MIASITKSVGSSIGALRPDVPGALTSGPQQPAPEKSDTAEEAPRVSGSVGSDESGLGTGARRGLIGSKAERSETDTQTGLTEAEKEVVDKLRARDVEVRRHEEAHARVGGQYAGQPSYSYQTGPDGKRYAIGGEVPIDVAPVPDDPKATIEKMIVVKAAALAPAEPSTADWRIATLAEAQRLQAQADLAKDRMEQAFGRTDDGAPTNGPVEPLDLAA